MAVRKTHRPDGWTFDIDGEATVSGSISELHEWLKPLAQHRPPALVHTEVQMKWRQIVAAGLALHDNHRELAVISPNPDGERMIMWDSTLRGTRQQKPLPFSPASFLAALSKDARPQAQAFLQVVFRRPVPMPDAPDRWPVSIDDQKPVDLTGHQIIRLAEAIQRCLEPTTDRNEAQLKWKRVVEVGYRHRTPDGCRIITVTSPIFGGTTLIRWLSGRPSRGAICLSTTEFVSLLRSEDQPRAQQFFDRRTAPIASSPSS